MELKQEQNIIISACWSLKPHASWILVALAFVAVATSYVSSAHKGA